jgi:hypothetical protein
MLRLGSTRPTFAALVFGLALVLGLPAALAQPVPLRDRPRPATTGWSDPDQMPARPRTDPDAACGTNCDEAIGTGLHVDETLAGRVLVGAVRLTASASGEGVRDLTVHFRGPLGLPADSDRKVAIATGEGRAPAIDQSFDTASLPPGRYIHYVDARDARGQRLRSKNQQVRIGPSTFRPRVLYDSDYTHILNIESPYNTDAAKTRRDSSSLTRGKIEAAFAEIVASGADTLVLSPGVGEVGWFRSSYAPLTRHRDWWRAATGREPPAEPLIDYVLKGGDPIDDARRVVDRAKKRLFVSIRMNDGHAYYLDGAVDPTTGRVLAGGAADLYRIFSEFQSTHPELRIGADPTLPTPRYSVLLDYSKGRPGRDPATGLETSVRGHKAALVKGMLDEHEVDGVVLDFMRLAYLFNQQQTTSEQRRAIMVEFLSGLRRELDGHQRDLRGKAPQLFVRIPYLPEEWDKLGVSIPEWALAGVDGFVFSFERAWAQPFYYGEGATKLPRFDAWKSRVGDGVSFLHEINYVTEGRLIPDPTGKTDAKSNKPRTYTVARRTRDQMIVSGAFAAKSLGADGFYFFNMPYYRGQDAYADPEVRVAPPFALFDCLRKLDCFGATSEPYYFLAPKGSLNYATLPKTALQLPRKAEDGRATFALYAPRPTNGWPKRLRLRIELEEPTARLAEVRVDGVSVPEMARRDEPYASPFRYGLSVPERTSSWDVDPAILKGSRVEIAITAAAGARPTIHWIDLTAQ